MNLVCARCGLRLDGEVLATRYFMRHGKTQMNLDNICIGSLDPPLNDVGITQSEKAARKFLASGKKLDLIVSSSMLRQRQTATMLASKIGNVRMRLDERLRERRVGEIEGKPETPESDAQLLRHNYLPKGATLLKKFEEETLFFLVDACDPLQFPAETLFVTSGFRMLTIVKLIRKWSVEQITKYAPPANCEIVEFKIGYPCKNCNGLFFEVASPVL